MKMIVMMICIANWLIPAAIGQNSQTMNRDSQVMHKHHPTGEAEGAPAVVTGYVRDIACLLRNPKAGAATSPLTQDCMLKCVRGGSPVGILTEQGELYTPISEVIPDVKVRSRLLPYVGKYVKASGRVFERGGLHAISIEKIQVIRRPSDSQIPTL